MEKRSRLEEIAARSAARKSAAGGSRLGDVAARLKAAKTMGESRTRMRNPLRDVEVTGDIEKDDKAETESLLVALRKSTADIIDNGYWLNLVFLNSAQRDEFLRKVGWEKYLDSSGTYVDGLAVAGELGISVPEATIHHRDSRRGARDLVAKVGVIKRPKV